MKPRIEDHCWGLLNKLKELQEENRIFEDEDPEVAKKIILVIRN